MENSVENNQKPKKSFWEGITWAKGMGIIGFLIGIILSVTLDEGNYFLMGIGGITGYGVGFIIQKIVK